MMPEDSVYGAWPRSGEIDIAESKGNNGDSYRDGRDSLVSALHWGPVPEVDAFYKTSGKHNLRRTDYTESFNTYGLEWSENYLFTYINSRLLVSLKISGPSTLFLNTNDVQQVFYVNFESKKNMWDRGDFGQTIVNHSALFDPWSQTGKANTPFDQSFYLILNVAVGGTNGYFP
jgi:beta-glucanase (GH16 family)